MSGPRVFYTQPCTADDAQITFVVYGHPMPKGSKTAVARGGRAYMIDAAPARSKDPEKRKAQRERMARWPADVEEVAVSARVISATACLPPIDGPVNVCARFFFPRPKTETRAQRLRIFHTGKPDLDKLLRGILDPMKKAGIFTDDCRVVSFNGSEKRYVRAVHMGTGDARDHVYRPRVEVTVTRLAEMHDSYLAVCPHETNYENLRERFDAVRAILQRQESEGGYDEMDALDDIGKVIHG